MESDYCPLSERGEARPKRRSRGKSFSASFLELNLAKTGLKNVLRDYNSVYLENTAEEGINDVLCAGLSMYTFRLVPIPVSWLVTRG